MARPGDNSRLGKLPAFDREPFRRAITGCMRAIAGEAELDVTFGNERPGPVSYTHLTLPTILLV